MSLVRAFVEEVSGTLIACSNCGIAGGGGTDLLKSSEKFGVGSAFIVFNGAEKCGGGRGRTSGFSGAFGTGCP